jgi:hypothetical protein
MGTVLYQLYHITQPGDEEYSGRVVQLPDGSRKMTLTALWRERTVTKEDVEALIARKKAAIDELQEALAMLNGDRQ